MNIFDTVIVGAGVIGCAIARILAQTNLSVLVVEKEPDTGFGSSSRNSGVVHSGIHYTPDSNRAIFNVQGNRMMEGLCSELKVPFKKSGKITVAFTDEQVHTLAALLKQGTENGVPDIKLIEKDEMEKLQPGTMGKAALYTPSTGIVSPYELTIALAESAYANGADFKFNHTVKSIEIPDQHREHFLLHTEHAEGSCTKTITYAAKVVINAAGLGSADIAKMAGIDDYTIYPCRGEYYVLDKRLKDSLNLLIYPVPGAHSSGLGIHLTNTVDGNILIGPSNEYIMDDEDSSTTIDIMKTLREEGHHLLPALGGSDFIRSFAGIRPKLAPPQEGGFRDFVIESRLDVSGFINLTGIESPGLTASPAIAEQVKTLVGELIPLQNRENFVRGRPVIHNTPFTEKRFSACSRKEKKKLISQNPDYGSIVCRCEEITLAEIKEAAARTLGPVTFTGIKYRTRAMMGRCQGGFCLQRLTEILRESFGIAVGEQTLKGSGTELFMGPLRTSQTPRRKESL
ncbi:MAG: NAD(P)/FAD-dependent oxidoreductase [Bacteroidetes bacterium]|nr:NAD(P)/FAD-dependent oxidoreductase [Bacteroidota bacterium]